MNILDNLKSQLPSCFSDFVLKDLNSKLLRNDELFTYKAIHCKCGHENFSVFGHLQIEIKGFFRKRESKTIIPPIYLECESCNLHQLIFNPEKHGWDGVNGDNATIVGSGTPEFIGLNGKIAVMYSYQGLDNYEDVPLELGRNMFDTFGLYIYYQDKIESILDCECA